MPSRIIRDWTDSTTIDQLSPEAEVFFVRLMMKADDFGRFHGDPRLLSSLCFPLRNIPTQSILKWIKECESAKAEYGPLVTYYDNANKKYIQINNFNQRLRQMVHRFPQPNSTVPSIDSKLSAGCQQVADNGRPDLDTDTDTDTEVETKEDTVVSSCPERPAASVPEEPAVMSFPCKGIGEKTWRLTQSKLNEYKESFPGVDVNGELLKARQWLRDRPSRQKTPGGMGRYLSGWLGKSQNAGRASGVAGTITPEPYDLAGTVERALSTPSPFYTPAMIARSQANGKA